MKHSQNKELYDLIVNSVVGYLRQQGFSSVKANTSGFSAPNVVKWDDTDTGVLPDITCEHNGALFVFEIETADALEEERVEDRWKLLSVHARRFNGKFYLVIPEQKADDVQDVVKSLDVQTELLKLSGVEGASN